jgi:hypothetical protein
MSMATSEEFHAMRPGDTMRVPIFEASATFGDERLLQSGVSLGSNFDKFIGDHRFTHQIVIDGDHLIITRKAGAGH